MGTHLLVRMPPTGGYQRLIALLGESTGDGGIAGVAPCTLEEIAGATLDASLQGFLLAVRGGRGARGGAAGAWLRTTRETWCWPYPQGTVDEAKAAGWAAQWAGRWRRRFGGQDRVARRVSSSWEDGLNTPPDDRPRPDR